VARLQRSPAFRKTAAGFLDGKSSTLSAAVRSQLGHDAVYDWIRNILW